MNEKRILVAVSALAAALGACSAEIVGDEPGTGGSSSGTGASPGSGGAVAGTGAGGAGATAGSGGAGGDPSVCVPGIPATSQIPRMTTAQYDAVVRDLVDVTALQASGNQPPSALLVPDFDGSLTDIAWNSYLTAAEQIAAQVMAGPNRSLFISCDPAVDACLTDTIRTFGRKAFRRPLSDEEVASFERLKNVTPQGTPEEIAEAILYAFLASPSFIMIPELSQEPEGAAVRLSNHEVAARLSFALWGSIPDEELNLAADMGLLSTKEQILAQAQRMLQDRDKAGPVVAAFHRAYADIRQGSHWGTVDHDPAKFPNYTAAAMEPMIAEMDAFFEEIAFNGGTFRDLMLSPLAFVNQDTAPLYGLDPAGYGPDLTPVELEPNERPGYLTRVGFLSSYSSYSVTSPILRGAYVSGRVLGIETGTPPPGATETPIPPGDYATQREAIEALTSPANCAGCHHTYVNPAGFVLERFDAVGSVQSVDALGGAIDGTAEVYFTETESKLITSPAELMTEIAARGGAQRRYVEQLVSFVMDRLPNSNDACVVDQLSANLTQDGYNILNLFTDLTQADSFRLRTVGN